MRRNALFSTMVAPSLVLWASVGWSGLSRVLPLPDESECRFPTDLGCFVAIADSTGALGPWSAVDAGLAQTLPCPPFSGVLGRRPKKSSLGREKP